MARNSSGTYTLPAGNPVTTATTISTVWANVTLGDIATEMTDSASRSGKGGFTAPVRTSDGTVAAPSVSFTSEPGSGLYKAGTGDVRVAVGGVDALKLIAGALSGPNATGPITLSGGTTGIQVTLANGFLLLQGNLDATNATNADTVLASTATRTAGYMVAVQNPVGTNKLFIDYRGLLRLEATAAAAAIQPASLWTAITPNANWSAFNGLGFWKDPTGIVRIKGILGFATGAVNPAFTLPAGFRPAAIRGYHLQDAAASGGLDIVVNTNGDVSTASGPVTGHTYYMDPISFLAEQ